MQGKRLKDLLAKFRRIGLVDDDWVPTENGHAFLREYTTKILPFLNQYGFAQVRRFQFDPVP